MKAIKRRKRHTTADIRKAFADLPPIKFVNEHLVPERLAQSLRRALRDVVVQRKGLSNPQWKVMRLRDVKERSDKELHDTFDRFFETLFDEMGPTITDSYFPRYSFNFQPPKRRPLQLIIAWRRICRRQLHQGKGEVHYSPRRPTVELSNGGKYIIGFRKHAIDRLCDRLVTTEKWRATSEAFAYLHDMQNVEPKGMAGFYVWYPCQKWELYNWLYEVIYKKKPGPRTCVREAWCPADIVGKFFVARTMLHPAMKVPGINASILTVSHLRAGNQWALEEFGRLNGKQAQFAEADKDVFADD